ncbi:major capsid protein [Mycobacterium phage Phrappuccino]|uniref:Major capsid protein n=1 Tax=Mycobacterium phage Phrappuccino TaxID=2591223 RepID=A0A514DDQ2_9CAUD|nr:major head protein [Mycobacterium phage Phrappuccino]QDH91730.1 major capsid protein [Mycobacterium phage Phrappuccino]QIQ63173.1 major capsid protein [Mycobacterium phage Settecandela]
MNLPAAVGSGFGRYATHSDEYVAQAQNMLQRMGRKLTAAEKQTKLANILRDRQNGLLRLGQSMIGPIQLQLRYQGILRNVLLEDACTPGVPIEYDVMDDLGQAYYLHGNEGEVKITPFEGKRMRVEMFRLATFPQIKKEDLYWLRSNIVEYAQDQSKQAIMRQEDSRLITLLEVAAQHYRTIDSTAIPGVGPLPNEITVASSYIQPGDLYTASSYTDSRLLDSTRLLCGPIEYRDFYRWEINNVGWAMKDSVVAGEKIVQFGEYQIGKSVIIPKGTLYLTPDPDYLGVFPVMYSLDVDEDNQVERFVKGWVMDELIGMAIINPRGIVIIRKAA